MEANGLFPADRNRLFRGDCLHVMRQLPGESIDLIYADPPFFTGRDYPVLARNGAKTLSFGDTWKDGLPGYVAWLGERLAEMRRLLKPSGSIFVHLDWHAGHYVKCEMDRVFGYENFRNEIVWHYESGGRARRFFPRKHDLIFWYSRSGAWVFNKEAVGRRRDVCPGCGSELKKWNHLKRRVDAGGRVFRTIKSAGKLYRYYDDEPTLPADVWLGINHLQQKDPERTGYPTQKPEALLARIVAAASNPGEVVADFFCGAGTTLAAAQRLERRWIGCDLSEEAVAVTAGRLQRLAAEGLAAVGQDSDPDGIKSCQDRNPNPQVGQDRNPNPQVGQDRNPDPRTDQDRNANLRGFSVESLPVPVKGRPPSPRQR